MIEFFFEGVLYRLRESWYLELLLIIIASWSLFKISYSSYPGKLKNLSILYLGSALILFGGGNLFAVFNITSIKNQNIIIEQGNNIFNFIEAYVFLFVLSSSIESTVKKKQVRVLLLFNLLLTIVGLMIPFLSGPLNRAHSWNAFFSVLHFYSILMAAIWYFQETYKHNKAMLAEEIVIIFSITAYSLISIPFFALLEFSVVGEFSEVLYAIHYIFLAFVFIAFYFSIRMKKVNGPNPQTC